MDKNQEANLSSWIENYSDDLYSWASYKLKDDNLAKDLVQDTFIAALSSWERFEGRSSVKTWLISILNNKIRDTFRKNKNRMYSLETLAGERNVDDFFDENGGWKPEHRPGLWSEEEVNLLDQVAFRKAFYGCIDGLSERFRQVVVGKYLESTDSTLLCQELGITASNFWQILHRAKLQLRICLEKRWFDRSE